jgi:hypothetical protein
LSLFCFDLLFLGKNLLKKQYKQMFGLFSKKDETEKLLRGRDPQAENIPIHTMGRDLESTLHPKKESANEPLKDSPQSASRINLNSLTDQQKTSPFLDKEKSAIIAPPKPIVTPVTKSLIPPVPQTALKPPVPDGKNSRDLKKLILTLIIILIITIALVGGYYFWRTRNNVQKIEPVAQENPTEEQPEIVPEGEIKNTEESPLSKFVTGELNYLVFDSSDTSPEAMKETLKSYVQEVQASGVNGAIEFKVIDAEKNPVSFPTFLGEMGIKFSPGLASSLDTSFSLYVYNDQGNPGVGLAITTKKDSNLKNILMKEERNLPRELAPLFPVTQYTLEKNKSFTTSEFDSTLWGKVGIRYLNIISPEDLSVDYALIDTGTKKLLLGTTKRTIRSIIESQKPEATAP